MKILVACDKCGAVSALNTPLDRLLVECGLTRTVVNFDTRETRTTVCSGHLTVELVVCTIKGHQ